mgnify:FL=1
MRCGSWTPFVYKIHNKIIHGVYKSAHFNKMSINTADKVANSEIANIINEIQVEDSEVSFKGYTHNKKGFVLQVNYLEQLNDFSSFDVKGYLCEPQVDLNNRTVNLYYTKIYRSNIMNKLFYLSLILICILYLCNKYLLLQNYMNPI